MSKCLNIILSITDIDEYIGKYYKIIELQLLPLFEYLEFPEKIEFDDELLKIATNLIKKSKTVSPVM